MKPYYTDDLVTIYNARCEDVLPSIDPASVDLLLTDPPYGMGMDTDYSATGGAGRLPGRKWDRRVEGDDVPFDPAHLLVYGRAVIWGANHFASRLPDSNGWIVWNKRGDGKPSGMHFGDCEIAWSNVAQGIRMFSNVWHGAPRWRAEPSMHPTQKPAALMRWLVEKFTDPGQLVLDPYMGSGPVAQACHELGRRYVGIELVEDYCKVAVGRLAQQTLDLTGGVA